MKIDDFDYFYFDLDRNIWDTIDKYGNKIWARQLIFPLQQESENTFIDDCLSKIVLQDGVVEFLSFLYSRNKNIGFISRGGNLNTSMEEQPSIKTLILFDLLKYFKAEKILIHKNQIKHSALTREKFIFFDDSEEEISLMKHHKKESSCILRSSFDSWRDLL